MPRLALLVLGLAAATQAKDADSAQQAAMNQISSAIQGAVLLAQAMPHDDGPKPTKAMQDKMDQAGPLIYSSYNVLQNAEQNAEAAVEQMKTGIQTASSASGISTAEALIQQGKEKLTKGSKLSQEANSDFMNKADPLGPPPNPPRSWGNVDAMSSRARSKLSSVQRLVGEAKRLARERGISLITVSSEKVVKL